MPSPVSLVPKNPDRPKITLAQIVGGIPVLAALIVAFAGVDLTDQQTAAIGALVVWAGTLNIGDAVLRKSRNDKDAVVQAAALTASSAPPVGPPAEPGVGDGSGYTAEELDREDDLDDDEDLVDDGPGLISP